MDLCLAQANHVIKSLVAYRRGTPRNSIQLGCLYFTKAIWELSESLSAVVFRGHMYVSRKTRWSVEVRPQVW